MITVEELSQCLPPALKSAANQQYADKVNQLVADPDVAESISNNFITLSKVLRDGKWKLDDYINAVQFVSFKLMNMTDKEAYMYTFPQRYNRLLKKGASGKDISAHISGYKKGKLVVSLMEQAAIPSWVLNQSVYQDAINHQAFLMKNAKSEKVQTEAANSLLTHLKKPESKQVEMDINVKETDGMKELKDLLANMAETQQALIQQGVNTRAIAHQGIGEMIDVTPEEEKDKV